MYPNKPLSLQKETNGSHNYTAMGILIIITGLVFMVLVFGSWGVATTEADGVQSAGQTAIEETPYVQSFSESKITEDISSEIQISEEAAPEVGTLETKNSDFLASEVVTGLGHGDVSVAQECDLPDFDVEAGEMVVCDYNLPDSLPTCITNAWLDDYYIKVCSYGGYHPVCCLSTITLTQQKEPCSGGIIYISWTPEETGCPCGAVMWTAQFHVCEPIILASNHVPNVDWCPGCEVVGGPDDLGKWVTASLSSTWAGCDGGDQMFTITGAENCIDVDPGLIMYWGDNIPGTLPVCITNSWLQDKWLMLAVWGGYHPCSDLTTITLSQDKSPAGGVINVAWTAIPTGGPCGAVLWKATFSVDDPIALEANAAPDEILGPDGEPIEGLFVTENEDLGKLVSGTVSSTWAGCGEADQQFVLIPAHKSFVPEFPTLDERYIASSNVAVRMTSLQA